jgi:uncharacterized protein (DUF983 family)
VVFCPQRGEGRHSWSSLSPTCVAVGLIAFLRFQVLRAGDQFFIFLIYSVHIVIFIHCFEYYLMKPRPFGVLWESGIIWHFYNTWTSLSYIRILM